MGAQFGLASGVVGEATFTAHARKADLYATGGVRRGFEAADIRYEAARATHVVNGGITRAVESGRTGGRAAWAALALTAKSADRSRLRPARLKKKDGYWQ